MKVTVYVVGKAKRSWLEEGIEEYTTRMRSFLKLEWVWVKDDKQLLALLAKESAAIALDPRGETLTSEAFAQHFFKRIEAGGARLAFVIGGAEGLPEELRQRLPLWSLSNLTFTHQMACLLLSEQIYRATEIRRGTPYHK